ncbi:hypothetical protein [Mycobacterium xenopi]|uniref:hypothetical protein n=1 Tax=Mycobacterium xenopi TaxID=1789 RepID=UPI0009DB01C0|nr:hypothetical protein [Mycobacterium xenopi]
MQAHQKAGAADHAAPRRVRHAGRASAPTRELRAPQSGPQTTPTSRPAERSARPKSASQAKARAKARKAKAPKVVRPSLRERVLTRLAAVDLRPRTLASRVPFVVLVIGSLGVGLGVTLWLSTDSAERSYELGNARQKTQVLQQQKEALERDVLQAQSAPALAEAARNLGMIPSRDTAHLVQDPSGNWVVVGTPKPAQGVPPPPLNTKLPDEKPPPPNPQVNPVEMPVRLSPGAGTPTMPVPPGPEVLLRAPDGATTLGTQHLPSGATPGVPAPQVAGPGPLPPPDAAPATPAPAAEVPLAAGPPPATALAPAVVPPSAPPATGEQFGPVTVTAPGTPR